MSRIVLIDYGMGNLHSVSKAVESLGGSIAVSDEADTIASADKIILPGVGAFPAAMDALIRRGLVNVIKEKIAQGTPYLGICLGLQLLFEWGDEAGGAEGLGVLAGKVRRFSESLNGERRIVPHMGWNQTQIPAGRERSALLQGIDAGAYFYFVHSYYVEPTDTGLVALQADYGEPFTAMVQRGSLFATQFHPEKSQAVGLKLLKNFIEL